MPTSTIWRRSHASPRPRGVSPLRPSAEFIERLSPEPSLGPASLPEPSLISRDPREDGYPLRGLGLSDAGFLEAAGVTAHPDHLYYDQDGAAHVGASRRGGAATQVGTLLEGSQDGLSKTPKLSQDPQRSKGKGHTRSGSTIDDLATAAIANSPALPSASPSSFSRGSPLPIARPSTSYIQQYHRDDSLEGPPAKRIKSERLAGSEWALPAERPRTSGGHNNALEISHEDALLLLGLKNEVNFKNNTPLLTSDSYRPHTLSPPSRRPSQTWNHDDLANAPVHRPRGSQFRQHEPLEDQMSHKGQADKVARSILFQNSSVLHPETIRAQSSSLAKQESSVSFAAASKLQEASRGTNVELPSTEPTTKKPRRVKPEVQAEVCAGCQRLQLESDDEDSATFWISCDGCDRWFHAECAGFKTKAEARSVDKYRCKDCEPVHGPTTYVRKSSRPRTAIDYAGLNQGLVKSSAETSTHHYIQPLKEGKMSLLPDDFARIRPELLTMEFMESFEGTKRPFVVPASWNPRFGAKPQRSVLDSDLGVAEALPYPLINSEGAAAGVDLSDSTDAVEEEVIDCDQDLLDMVIPRGLTVRKVAELYGPDELVPVIDVKSQETKGQFTLQQWADYYEERGEKPIRNVISLEVSHSPLGKLIRRPKVVRDLDLEDHVWEADVDTRTKKRPVQFYCLMSVADSYTDFHIDFGGSSVYYHILKGTKTFFFIPPEDRYLRKYEDWCNSDAQNETWLGDLCGGNCTRVDLHEGDTAFIPAGWIHSVWTPEDSLVIGGNFLTRVDYEMQLKVANIEKVTKVAPKFRYPYFQKVMWYALIKYLDEDPIPDEVLEDFRDDPEYTFLRANPIWHEVDELENEAEPGEPVFNSRFYPKAEVSGWPALRDYLYRTARIDAGLPVPDITKKQIEAVKASIPKGHGDPLLMVKLFAIWCAWKCGNISVPEWVYSDGALEPAKIEKLKKPESFRLPGERSSSRKASQAHAQAQAQAQVQSQTPPAKPASKGNGLRVACEPCRKRRIKCRHKSGSETPRPAPEIRPRSFSNTDFHSPNGAFTNGGSVEEMSSEARFSESAGSTIEVAPSDAQSSSKKSRSKACEECRKSKRRCVHDQFGRIDPAKVAEPSKPRGSSNAKRISRLSHESMQNKRARTDVDSIDDLIDPALTNADTSQVASEGLEDDSHTPGPVSDESRAELNGNDDTPAPEIQVKRDVDSVLVPVDPILEETTTTAESLTIKSELDQVNGIALQDNVVGFNSPEEERDEIICTPAPVHFVSPMNGNSSGIANSTPRSRHSSRQPKQIERYTPEEKRSPSKPQPKQQRVDRRASSAASAQTVVTSAKSRRSSSNTSGTIHQMAVIMARRSASLEVAARPVSRGSTGAESDIDADEKFARELHAAENGLRRRTSMRA